MRTTCIALLSGILLFAGVAFAHHGTANYDTTKTISIKGVVTDFQFVNPHVQIVVDVKDENGKAKTWPGELTSPNRLSRLGGPRVRSSRETLLPLADIPPRAAPRKSGFRKLRWPAVRILRPAGEISNRFRVASVCLYCDR